METFTRNDLHGPEGTDLGTAILSNLNADMEVIDNSLAKGHWTAVIDPVAGDDNLDGYSAGSIWVNTADHRVFLCEDATTATAIWRQIWPAEPEEANPGWLAAGETWTYYGANDPVYSFTVPGDQTAKYSAGMKIKLTQTTAKYFIINDVWYDFGVYGDITIVILYGGTDYDLADAAITSPFYSTQHAPSGFSLDKAKWRITVTSAAELSQLAPTNGTVYNLGSTSITIPIGQWFVSYQVMIYAYRAVVGEVAIYSTLSTAVDSESDNEFTSCVYSRDTYAGLNTAGRTKLLTLAVATPYYFNAWTNKDNIGGLLILGNQSLTRIVAECAYL